VLASAQYLDPTPINNPAALPYKKHDDPHLQVNTNTYNVRRISVSEIIFPKL
jgi:hypothetical protein